MLDPNAPRESIRETAPVVRHKRDREKRRAIAVALMDINLHQRFIIHISSIDTDVMSPADCDNMLDIQSPPLLCSRLTK